VTRGVILAGGGATRFGGTPKGLERVGGERILDRLVRTLTDATGTPPLLIANAPDAASWRPDLHVIPDIIPGLGALGGLLTAVEAAPAPVVVVAWDMPFVPAGLLRSLMRGLEGVDACLPASPGRRGLEPMCAAYGPGSGPAIRAAIGRGERQAIAFHSAIKVGILSAEQVRDLGDPAFMFYNVNTSDDLAEAERLWQKHGSSR
jgi:molybdopterin-guanine dinucleotide biosynthesis protein A